jgi:hypothetical protein
MEMGSQLYAPVALFPEKKTGVHRIGGWVGPMTDLNLLERKKSVAPSQK